MVTLWSAEGKIITRPPTICLRLEKETNVTGEAKKEDKCEEETFGQKTVECGVGDQM